MRHIRPRLIEKGTLQKKVSFVTLYKEKVRICTLDMVLQYSKYTVRVLLSNYKHLIFQSDQVTDGDRSVLLDKTCGVNRPGTITSNTGRSASFINVIISNHNLSPTLKQ